MEQTPALSVGVVQDSRIKSGERAPQEEIVLTNLDRILDVELLYLIQKGPMSGYDLRRKMHNQFHQKLSYGTIYPHLRKFERGNLVSGEWSPRTVGSKKKMYVITEKGKAVLRKCFFEFAEMSKELS